MTSPITANWWLPGRLIVPSATTLFAALYALLLVLPAFVVAAWPAATQALEFQRTTLAQGELWRAITGHWTHWDSSHLLLDAAAFVLLATACARRAPGKLLLCLSLAAPAISLALWQALPLMSQYRGLSGLDAALFTLLAGWQLRDALRSNGRPWVAGLALAALALKIVYELATGDAFFLAQENSGFVPIPLAHAVGGLVGLAVSWLPGSKSLRPRSWRVGTRATQGSLGPTTRCRDRSYTGWVQGP